MPRSPRIDFPDAVYHVTTRGNGRADIFFSDDDRQRFLAQLSHHLQQTGIVLYAYGLDAAILKTHGRHAGVAKAVAVALASRFVNLSGRAIGEHDRIGSSAIGAIHRRLAERPEALKIVESLATQLKRKRIKYKA
jgi:hypothetical protein